MYDQVVARVIAYSKCALTGKEIITFEWEFPRIILAEVNTHNALSKNASSSRAIPSATILDQIRNNPAMPVRFGKKNSGMQDAGEHNEMVVYRGEYYTAEEMWSWGCRVVAEIAEAFDKAGYAKQISNRWTEVGQRMKQVVTATDLENFFWLRDHHMADPTIEALAKAARKARDEATPVVLQPGEWHVPYYNDGVWIPFKESIGGLVTDKYGFTLQQALDISASCCAQVSYRKLDDTVEKARAVVARLNLNGEEPDQPVHASPLEHQATPVKAPQGGYVKVKDGDAHGLGAEWAKREEVNITHFRWSWEPGITHVTRDGQFGSGNLKGWIQHRQLVPNHVREG